MSSHFEPATKITKTFSGRQIIVGRVQSSASFSRESLSSGQASMLSHSSSFPAHLQPAKPPNQLHPTQSTGSHESNQPTNHPTNQPGQPVSLFKLGCRSWPRNPGLSPTQKKVLVAEGGSAGFGGRTFGTQWSRWSWWVFNNALPRLYNYLRRPADC